MLNQAEQSIREFAGDNRKAKAYCEVLYGKFGDRFLQFIIERFWTPDQLVRAYERLDRNPWLFMDWLETRSGRYAADA